MIKKCQFLQIRTVLLQAGMNNFFQYHLKLVNDGIRFGLPSEANEVSTLNETQKQEHGLQNANKRKFGCY